MTVGHSSVGAMRTGCGRSPCFEASLGDAQIDFFCIVLNLERCIPFSRGRAVVESKTFELRAIVFFVVYSPVKVAPLLNYCPTEHCPAA